MLAWGSFFIVNIAIAEILHKRFGWDAEIGRKISHVLCGLGIFLLPFFIDFISIIILGLIFTLVLIVAYNNKLLAGLNNVNRESFGTILFPLGCTVAAILCINNSLAFQIAILIITIADPLTWFVFAKLKKPTLTKNNVGSLFFALITLTIWLIAGVYLHSLNLRYLINIILVSLVTFLIERNSYFGSDNYLIPVISAAFGRILF